MPRPVSSALSCANLKTVLSQSGPANFYRITFTLPPDDKPRTTYVRAENEDGARKKLIDRYGDEPATPVIGAIDEAEGEFITD